MTHRTEQVARAVVIAGLLAAAAITTTTWWTQPTPMDTITHTLSLVEHITPVAS